MESGVWAGGLIDGVLSRSVFRFSLFFLSFFSWAGLARWGSPALYSIHLTFKNLKIPIL